jgi:hypothetical protein
MRALFQYIILFVSFSIYGQKDTLAVIRHTDNDFVIPKSLKSVYVGIINELFIDVPTSRSFEVTGAGNTKKDKNIYEIFPEFRKENMEIVISIVLKNNKKVSEKHIFKVKRTGGFQSAINGRVGVVDMKKENLKNANVTVRFEDKNLTFRNSVASFSVKLPGYKSIVINGNKIDEITFQKILRNISKGDQIVIFDVKMIINEPSLRNAMCFKTTPLVVNTL